MMTIMINFSNIKTRCSIQKPICVLFLKKNTCKHVNIIVKFKKKTIFVYVCMNHFALVIVIFMFTIFSVYHLTARATISNNHFQHSHLPSNFFPKPVSFYRQSLTFIENTFQYITQHTRNICCFIAVDARNLTDGQAMWEA